MEMLKLFATYETALPLASQEKRLRDQGWQTKIDDVCLHGKNGELTLQLEPSGDGLFMLRGEARSHPSNETNALLAFLRDCAEPFQLDIFEEDGRLVRRVSSAD